MDIPLNVKVSCSDGPCGKSTHLILMPTNGEITHVVVEDGSFLKQGTSFPLIGLPRALPNRFD